MESPNSPSLTSFNNLPKEKSFGVDDLHQYEGFWYKLPHLEAAMSAKANFKAQNDDILLASSMKTGSTWLKALIPCIVSLRSHDHNIAKNDPLEKNHPNALMPSLIQLFTKNPNPDLTRMSSPRLFRTHFPYSLLPDSVKSSGCKIVYITRNPKDVFVSLWHFMNTLKTQEKQELETMSEAFESFCRGVHPFGPFHDHVLEYYKESLKRPEKIIFLKYEDLKRDPKGELKKLAEFLGRPFLNEEEVDDVLWRCSFERLKNLEVNKSGVDVVGFSHEAYFRKGVVGDWENHLSEQMKEKLDNITHSKLKGSGLVL